MNRRGTISQAQQAGQTRRSNRRGMILLELVIGLSLFAVASIFVLDGLTASVRGVDTARMEADAADLCVTVFSEIQMGQVEMVDSGPNAFEDEQLADWTWEVVVVQQEDLADVPQLKQVEVIIARTESEYKHRVAKLLWEDPNAALEEDEEVEAGVLP